MPSPFCGPLPADGTNEVVDSYQVWSTLAFGFELTSDPQFITCAEQLLGAPLKPGLAAEGDKNLPNLAVLIALSEFL